MHPPRRRGAKRRSALVALAIVVVIVAGGSSLSAFAYTSVRGQASRLQTQVTVHLQLGQSELEAAKTSLNTANAKHDLTQIAQANVHFTTAKVQFMVARQMADSSRLLQQLEGIPAVGQMAQSQHAAIDGITDMGVAISNAGLELAKLDAQLIKPSSGGGQQGATLLSVLDQTSKSLVIVQADLVHAEKAATQVDVRVLTAAQQLSFVKAKSTISSALAAADEFARLVPILTELLGGNGVRRYLVEQVNPSELRPGGGFIGTFSELQADHGSLRLLKSGPAEELIGARPGPGQVGYIAPPGALREFVPNAGWSFIDSNFYPDFPSNAVAGENFAQPRLGHALDGVISIDYYAVAKMLEVTGPLAVPGYGITVTSANFVAIVVSHDLADDNAHKAILSTVAGPLMDRIATLPPDKWPALITALNELSGSRHLQAFFNNPAVQKEIDRVGWSGAVNPTSAPDYAMEVEANLGGTKANYFIDRHFTVELARSGNTLHHKVTIDITDNMPFNYRPREYYSAFLRLFVSGNASNPSNNLRPPKYPNPGPPAGTRALDGWVPLFHGYGHSAQAVFQYDTPWSPDGRGVGKLYWQKQPGTDFDKIDVRWNDGSGHAYSISGDLTQDRVFNFSSKGITTVPGHAAQAQLPGLSLG